MSPLQLYFLSHPAAFLVFPPLHHLLEFIPPLSSSVSHMDLLFPRTASPLELSVFLQQAGLVFSKPALFCQLWNPLRFSWGGDFVYCLIWLEHEDFLRSSIQLAWEIKCRHPGIVNSLFTGSSDLIDSAACIASQVRITSQHLRHWSFDQHLVLLDTHLTLPPLGVLWFSSSFRSAPLLFC